MSSTNTQLPDLSWVRSSLCESGQCVELAAYGHQVAIRDSKLGNTSPIAVMPVEQLVRLTNNGLLWPALAAEGLQFTEFEKITFFGGFRLDDFRRVIGARRAAV